MYETRNYASLIKLFESNLTENGVVIISSKAYYYGNGGSVAEFKSYLDGTALEYSCLKQVVTNMSNRREIFLLKFKAKSEESMNLD